MRVLYPGGFDALHHGHHTALATARRIAGNGHLTAAVNSDAFLAYYKRIPSRTQNQRAADVMSTGYPDEVVIWDGPTGQDTQILAHTPDLYIAGVDWLTKNLAQQLRLPSLAWFDQHNISLLFLARTPGVSTTELLEQAMRASSDSETASNTES